MPNDRRNQKLMLVRHSIPQIDPSVPAREWRLSDVGIRRAASLAAHLAGCDAEVIWSSREPKASETACIIGDALGLPCRVLEGLEEHHREHVPFFDSPEEFEHTVEQFFANPHRVVMGSETAQQTLDRFTAAIQEVMRANVGDCIAVTHGTAMALYVASVTGVEPMGFWRTLELPCLVEVSLTRRSVGPILTSE